MNIQHDILNLDPDFAPFGEGEPITIFDFPSGCEPHIKIHRQAREEVVITCRIRSARDLMLLLLATDAVKRMGAKRIKVFIPYLPFARQDRVMDFGEPLSVKVIADVINAQSYEAVWILDAHSDVAPALINNCNNISAKFLARNILHEKESVTLISPDAGASKKIYGVSSLLRDAVVIVCGKHRDPRTGTLSGCGCPVQNFEGREVFLVDDICDGGGTFVLLADLLKSRGCGNINLIVTHGIFSKGIDALTGIDHIYTTDSFPQESHKKLTVIPCSQIIF